MDSVLNAMYSPWPTSLMGVMAALCILALACSALWRSGKSGLQQRQQLILSAILFGVAGIIMLGTSAHLGAVQIDSYMAFMVDTPDVSTIALFAHAVVVFVLGGATIMALTKRMPIGSAGTALLFAVSLTTFADLLLYSSVQADFFPLAITLGYYLVVITSIAFMAIATMLRIRAYGERQFVKGQKTALDSAQSKRAIGV